MPDRRGADAAEAGPVLPRPLPLGGVVGVCAPAGPVNARRLAAGLEGLRRAGLRPVLAPHLLHRQGHLGGDDRARAADLNALLADPAVDAVLCARGGYGAMRILPLLDLAAAASRPKPFVGYSDVTVLHLAFAAAGLVSFHGPVVEEGDQPAAETNRAALLRALTDGTPLGRLVPPPGAPRPRTLVPGRARGRLVGGNLSLLAATLGTAWEVDTRGALLLLEDVREEPYRVDRYLTQLWLAGKLQAAVGFVLGEFVDCAPSDGDGPGVADVLAERLVPLGKPAAADFCLGHGPVNLTVPLGVPAELDADEPALCFPEPALA